MHASARAGQPARPEMSPSYKSRHGQRTSLGKGIGLGGALASATGRAGACCGTLAEPAMER